MQLMENNKLEQALDRMPQPAPTAELDAKIMDGVKRLLALENYQKAEQLLISEGGRLDQATRVHLATSMAGIREQFGPGFEQAYQMHQDRQSAQVHVSEQDDLQF
jgi:hypothetical protein